MELTEEAIIELIESKLASQEVKFNKQILQLLNENNVLKERVETLENDLIIAFTDIEENKRATFSNDQYQRRNNLEISGIPDSFEGEELEKVCINLVNTICCTAQGEDFDYENAIGPGDIEGCHRLNSKNKNSVKNTIIRFVNRKVCDDAMSNKSRLKDAKIEELGSAIKNIYFNENLCTYYKDLAARCRRLRKSREIDETWTKNGIVRIKMKNGRIRSITHQADLDNMFPRFVYFASDRS